MRYYKGDLTVDAKGGFKILEANGFVSEELAEYERKREASKAKFKEVAAQRYTCPECSKEVPVLSRNKHHAAHQKENKNVVAKAKAKVEATVEVVE
jgi:hypothetical protein